MLALHGCVQPALSVAAAEPSDLVRLLDVGDELVASGVGVKYGDGRGGQRDTDHRTERAPDRRTDEDRG